MRKIRDEIIYKSYNLVGKSKIINFLVSWFYQKILIPSIEYYIKKLNLGLINITIRNSLASNEEFNFLLSDIDTCLILAKDADAVAITKKFIELKKFFIMLDYPEIYSEEEYELYKTLKNKTEWPIVEAFWLIRKINWSRISLQKNPSKLNRVKMERSIRKSLKKIIKNEIDINKKQYFLDELKNFDLLFDCSRKDICISCYSDFLENNNGIGISIELSRIQFLNFNYLYPGDTSLDNEVKYKIADQLFSQCKASIVEFEKLIVKSSIVLEKAKENDTSHLYNFLKLLN